MTYHWLIYRSRPTTLPWPNAILDIARSAEANNETNGVTGLLLFSNSCYLQYIEGEHAALERLWQAIRADERHAPLWKVDGKTDTRRMPGLSMGYYDGDRESPPVEAARIWRDRYDWRGDQSEDLIALLTEFAREKYPSLLRNKNGN